MKTEGHTRTVTLLKVRKQTAYLYYWLQVTTVFLDDFNGTYSACLRGLYLETCPELLKFSCLEKFLLCPGQQLLQARPVQHLES